ncbi:MAG: DedA family protein [Rhodoglobus sp.]
MDVWSTWIEQSLASPWLYIVLLALVIADAFLVILPSETLVVALGSLALSTGTPNLGLVIATATVGAIIGDNACYWIGRVLPIDRMRWLRKPKPAAAFARARAAISARPASLILTARYIPFARIAVNLTAGATGFEYRRYVPLTMIAGFSWAVYNVAVGALFGAWLADNPVLAVVVSVLVAISLGLVIDGIVARVSARRALHREQSEHPEEQRDNSEHR